MVHCLKKAFARYSTAVISNITGYSEEIIRMYKKNQIPEFVSTLNGKPLPSRSVMTQKIVIAIKDYERSLRDLGYKR